MSGITLQDGFTSSNANLSMGRSSWKCDKILTQTDDVTSNHDDSYHCGDDYGKINN